jgi:pimeloyl-ACP methyl ester carboxylesterase
MNDPNMIHDWTDIDWTAHTHTTFLRGGRVHYLDIGSGPALVLLHGLGMSWRVWLRNLADLARDHRVVAVDLPGFGQSSRLPWRFDLGGHAEVVIDLLHRIDALPCTLVGHSLGGLVAQHAALRMGADVDALILTSSPDSGTGAARRLAAFTQISALRTLVYSRAVENWLIKASFLHPTLFGRLVADTGCLDAGLLTTLSRGYATDGFWRGIHAALADRVSEHIGALRVPTLVLAGAADAVVPAAAAQRLAAAIPDATLTIWSRVGHAPMLERPAEFAAAVRTFVASSRSRLTDEVPHDRA